MASSTQGGVGACTRSGSFQAVKWGLPVFLCRHLWRPPGDPAVPQPPGREAEPPALWQGQLDGLHVRQRAPRKIQRWDLHVVLEALTHFLSCPMGVLKPSSEISPQLYTFTCLTLLYPLTLNVHNLALGDNAGVEALWTNCHLIRTPHTLLLWWGGLHLSHFISKCQRRVCETMYCVFYRLAVVWPWQSVRLSFLICKRGIIGFLQNVKLNETVYKAPCPVPGKH